MLGVLAVVLCRLFVTCAGIAVGILDTGACATVIAVAVVPASHVTAGGSGRSQLSPSGKSLPVCPVHFAHFRASFPQPAEKATHTGPSGRHHLRPRHSKSIGCLVTYTYSFSRS